MVATSQRRWALSLADIALLIACLLLLSFRTDAGAAAASGARAATIRLPITSLFEPGEAVLRPGVAARVRAQLGDAARPGIRVAVDRHGTARLDAWELAAARTAAIARALDRDARLRAPGGRTGSVEISRN